MTLTRNGVRKGCFERNAGLKYHLAVIHVYYLDRFDNVLSGST